MDLGAGEQRIVDDGCLVSACIVIWDLWHGPLAIMSIYMMLIKILRPYHVDLGVGTSRHEIASQFVESLYHVS